MRVSPNGKLPAFLLCRDKHMQTTSHCKAHLQQLVPTDKTSSVAVLHLAGLRHSFPAFNAITGMSQAGRAMQKRLW